MKNYILLKCTSGILREKEWFFMENNKMVTIGRKNNQNQNDIDIPGETNEERMISRENTRIYIDFPKVYLSNWNSTHGTYVNGEPMFEKICGDEYDPQDDWFELRSNDVISLGPSGRVISFQIEIHADKVDTHSLSIEEAYEILTEKLTALRNAATTGESQEKTDVLPKENSMEKEEQHDDNQQNELEKGTLRAIKTLGEGGFGKVYLCEDENTGEKKAFKYFKEFESLTVEKRKIFLREAGISLFVEHPNLVKSYNLDFLENEDGFPEFGISMEYCNQGDLLTLKENSRNSILDIGTATKYILQALDGLDYLHNVPLQAEDEDGTKYQVNGIVHRDIKPQNILLTSDGDDIIAKIGDFGLSKPFELAGLSNLSESGMAGAKGTLPFVSRRQFLNTKYARPDVDVFSMAATYYYLLTDECIRPFIDNPYAKENRLMIEYSKLIPIREANPEIPKALADVIDGILKEERLPDKSRFTTAKEFKEKIIRALNQ